MGVCAVGATNGSVSVTLQAPIGDLPVNKSLGGPGWGIDVTGRPYFDAAGATAGDLAYLALDAYGRPFLLGAQAPGAQDLLEGVMSVVPGSFEENDEDELVAQEQVSCPLFRHAVPTFRGWLKRQEISGGSDE